MWSASPLWGVIIDRANDSRTTWHDTRACYCGKKALPSHWLPSTKGKQQFRYFRDLLRVPSVYTWFNGAKITGSLVDRRGSDHFKLVFMRRIVWIFNDIQPWGQFYELHLHHVWKLQRLTFSHRNRVRLTDFKLRGTGFQTNWKPIVKPWNCGFRTISRIGLKKFLRLWTLELLLTLSSTVSRQSWIFNCRHAIPTVSTENCI